MMREEKREMTKMEKHIRAFGGKEKPIIGCLHLRALPGAPMWDRGLSMEEHIDLILADAKILKEAGFDAFVFANESDYPYVEQVGPEIVAAYTRIVTAVTSEFKLPFGVGIMFDPLATVAVAKATGASFIRGMLHGVLATDFGLMSKTLGETLRYAKKIGAEDLNIYSAVEGHFGVSLDTRPVEQKFAEGKLILPLSGYLLGAPKAGTAPEESMLAKLKQLDPTVPLILNNGAKVSNVKGLLPYCDGVLVGTALKKDGYLYNPVDRDRAEAFIQAAKG